MPFGCGYAGLEIQIKTKDQRPKTVSLSNQTHRRRILRIICVIVKASSGLAPVQTCKHHPLQEWRRSKTLLTKFIKHDFSDVVGRVEADKITKREWAHRITATEFHRIVDVHNLPATFLKRSDGIEHIRYQQAIYNESGLIAGSHRHLSQSLAKLDGLLVNGFVCKNCSYHFHELHQWHGIEEMHANETALAIG